MKRLVILILLFAGSVYAETPVVKQSVTTPPPVTKKVAAPKAVSLPQNLLDALAVCEADRQAVGAADASIAAAQAQLTAATDAKGKATLAAANDYAAFLTLWQSLYPTPAPPVPPTPPVPPPVPPPTPPTPPPTPPAVTTKLTLIEGTGTWCAACAAVDTDTLPALKTLLGADLSVFDYTAAAAKIAYPESALVPRWVLTRPDGTVEKKIGYLTIEQAKAWLGVSP